MALSSSDETNIIKGNSKVDKCHETNSLEKRGLSECRDKEIPLFSSFRPVLCRKCSVILCNDFSKILDFILNYGHVCVCVGYVNISVHIRRTEERTGSPGAATTAGCEQLHVGGGNQPWVLR